MFKYIQNQWAETTAYSTNICGQTLHAPKRHGFSKIALGMKIFTQFTGKLSLKVGDSSSYAGGVEKSSPGGEFDEGEEDDPEDEKVVETCASKGL